MMNQKIVRYFDTVMRAADNENGNMTVEGYALKFDKETQIGSGYWGYMESISREAMNTADMSDVVLNYNHNDDSILAGTRNNSLTLTVDDVGLKVAANIVDTATGRDVYKLISDGLITKMSFAVIVKESKWTIAEDDSEEMDKRQITAFGRFFDVSAVTFPAYDDTAIAARSRDKSEHEAARRAAQLAKLDKIMRRKQL